MKTLNSIASVLLLFSMSELSFSNAEFKVRYCSPTNECNDVATLFGRNPNNAQHNEEFVFLDESKKTTKVFAGNVKGFSLIYGDEKNNEIYASIKGDIKRVEFANSHYTLNSDNISAEHMRYLIEKSKLLPDKNKLNSDKERKWAEDDKLKNLPNQVLVWKTAEVANCGEVKYVVRTNQMGKKDIPGLDFERHGKFYIPYDIQGIVCTPEGRVILQLAYWSGAAYSQSIAIIDTGIKAVSH